jgi:hypothetical protein
MLRDLFVLEHLPLLAVLCQQVHVLFILIIPIEFHDIRVVEVLLNFDLPNQLSLQVCITETGLLDDLHGK